MSGALVHGTSIMMEKKSSSLEGTVQDVPVCDLYSFPDHPFGVREDESFSELVESIKSYGILAPLIVRSRKAGGYEIVAGHRRKRASELAGCTTVPVLLRELDDDKAIIILVDSNLQREYILPSERAKAYKMKLDAIKRQGARTDLTSTQVAQKLSVEKVAEDEGISRDQVRRYIRLTHLQPEFQQMVDERKLGLMPAVELSYLSAEEQTVLLDAMDAEQSTPSLSQAQRLKRLSRDGALDFEKISEVISEETKPAWERVVLQKTELNKYFPDTYTPHQMEQVIWRLLQMWQNKNQRKAS